MIKNKIYNFRTFDGMEELINFLLQYGNLNTQQVDLIKSKGRLVTIEKDNYYVTAGKVFRDVVFVVKGIMRIAFYKNDGEEVTKYFIEEYKLFTNPYKEEPFTEYIQAVEPCELIVFSQKDWADLSHTILDWDKLIHKIFQKALMEKLDRRSALVSEDATTRYNTFLQLFPGLANRIPLSYIASYLGITQQSLSRIRKNIR